MFIFLVIIVVILYRRKKLYGGFYVLTAPPPIDYIAKIDKTKSLMEQYNKLPYISDWEFPRERIQIGKRDVKLTCNSFLSILCDIITKCCNIFYVYSRTCTCITGGTVYYSGHPLLSDHLHIFK